MHPVHSFLKTTELHTLDASLLPVYFEINRGLYEVLCGTRHLHCSFTGVFVRVLRSKRTLTAWDASACKWTSFSPGCSPGQHLTSVWELMTTIFLRHLYHHHLLLLLLPPPLSPPQQAATAFHCFYHRYLHCSWLIVILFLHRCVFWLTSTVS